MGQIPIALQLYSIREDCARDLEGSIKAVADMGYEGVEFAGYYERGAYELKRLCDAHGLQIVGTRFDNLGMHKNLENAQITNFCIMRTQSLTTFGSIFVNSFTGIGSSNTTRSSACVTASKVSTWS